MGPSLADVQSLLWRLITAPSGVEEGLRTERNLPPEGIGAVISGDSRLTAIERVDIYANMYFYRLLDAIQEDFPATLKILGDFEFHNLITGYLIEYPPSNPSITEASRHLAEFVESSPVLKQKPFVADLVRLERALVEVFLEADRNPLTVDDLRTTPAQEWLSLRIALHPAVQLLDCEWRVDELLRAVDLEQSIPAPIRERRSIIVWRNQCAVNYRAIDDVERRALANIRCGNEFRLMCEAVAAEVGDVEAPALTSRMLLRWLADGILVRALE
jgi:hypothetical protein